MQLSNWIKFMDSYESFSVEFKASVSFELFCKLYGVTKPTIPDNVLLFRKG